MAELLAIDFTEISKREFIQLIRDTCSGAKRDRHRVVTPNLNFTRLANSDKKFMELIHKFEHRFCDSQILYALMKMMGTGVPEKMAGSDLSKMILSRAGRENWRVALFGSSYKTQSFLKKSYDNIVFGESPPVSENPHKLKGNAAYIKAINKSKPDILLVALGAQKQEIWLDENWDDLEVPIAMCIGAGLDFLSGEVKRAPRLLQKVGLEWFWRLCLEPSRLIGRYLQDGWFLFRNTPRIACVAVRNRLFEVKGFQNKKK